MRFVCALFVLLVLFACSPGKAKKREVLKTIEGDLTVPVSTINLDSIYSEHGLVNLELLDPRFIVDLRYATLNNFIGEILYDTINAAYLQKDVAERLVGCQDFLDSIKPGYRLKILDAVRPLQVQYQMWEALDSIPRHKRGMFVSNPVLGSVHNFGAAVDITICDRYGRELDMGAEYDDFREIAYPSKEWKFLNSGELSKKQVDNRKLLRKVMSHQQFRNIPTEWWHFNACSRITAEYKYAALLTESGQFEKRHSARNAYQRSQDTLLNVNKEEVEE
jgi:D-alanyl-D-alanine dipeptidase